MELPPHYGRKLVSIEEVEVINVRKRREGGKEEGREGGREGGGKDSKMRVEHLYQFFFPPVRWSEVAGREHGTAQTVSLSFTATHMYYLWLH